MQNSLTISQSVISRLQNTNSVTSGQLYGKIFKNTQLILGIHIQDTTSPLHIVHSFPTGIDLCGIFKIDKKKESESNLNELSDISVTDNPLYIHKHLDNGSIKAFTFINDRLHSVKYTIQDENEIYNDLLHLRLKTNVPLICDLSQDSVLEEIKEFTNNMSLGMVVFKIFPLDLFVMGSGIEGIKTESTMRDVINAIDNDEEEDGGGYKFNSSKLPILNVSMYRKATIDPHLDSIKRHAPIVHIDKRLGQKMIMSLEVDALSIVHKNMPITCLYDVLIESAYRNLKLILSLLLQHLDDNGGDQLPITHPELFHFFPKDVGHFVTRVYDQKKSDVDLVSERKLLHKQFLLSMAEPMFRRSNKYKFKGEEDEADRLENPHEQVKPTNNGGEIAVVKGTYAYYHYLQDNEDDDGWGCAYRSLQTLASWLLKQGHTIRKVPTIKEIQKCLVDIGDKPSSFVGSKQWIGSTEVSFVLDSLLGIESKIMYCSSGAEVAQQGADLMYHFKTVGSPVMIGGGVLAHTILGVDYNNETGNIKFLILDPHYTGKDDLQVILKKGWCGWKNADFWDKKSYYNMCLPQIPRGI